MFRTAHIDVIGTADTAIAATAAAMFGHVVPGGLGTGFRSKRV